MKAKSLFKIFAGVVFLVLISFINCNFALALPAADALSNCKAKFPQMSVSACEKERAADIAEKKYNSCLSKNGPQACVDQKNKYDQAFAAIPKPKAQKATPPAVTRVNTGGTTVQVNNPAQQQQQAPAPQPVTVSSNFQQPSNGQAKSKETDFFEACMSNAGADQTKKDICWQKYEKLMMGTNSDELQCNPAVEELKKFRKEFNDACEEAAFGSDCSRRIDECYSEALEAEDEETGKITLKTTNTARCPVQSYSEAKSEHDDFQTMMKNTEEKVQTDSKNMLNSRKELDAEHADAQDEITELSSEISDGEFKCNEQKLNSGNEVAQLQTEIVSSEQEALNRIADLESKIKSAQSQILEFNQQKNGAFSMATISFAKKNCLTQAKQQVKKEHEDDPTYRKMLAFISGQRKFKKEVEENYALCMSINAENARKIASENDQKIAQAIADVSRMQMQLESFKVVSVTESQAKRKRLEVAMAQLENSDKACAAKMMALQQKRINVATKVAKSAQAAQRQMTMDTLNILQTQGKVMGLGKEKPDPLPPKSAKSNWLKAMHKGSEVESALQNARKACSCPDPDSEGVLIESAGTADTSSSPKKACFTDLKKPIYISPEDAGLK